MCGETGGLDDQTYINAEHSGKPENGRKFSIITKLNITKIQPTGPTISKNCSLKPKNEKNGIPIGFVSSSTNLPFTYWKSKCLTSWHQLQSKVFEIC